MINLIKKDLRLIVSRRWIFIGLILVLTIFTSFYYNSSSYKFTILFIYTATIGIFIQNDKEDTLIHSLPVSKYEVVLSKYILMFILFIISILFIILISLALKGLNRVDDISYLNLNFIVRTLLATMAISSIGIPISVYFGKGSRLGGFINGVLFYFSLSIMSNWILNYEVSFRLARYDLRFIGIIVVSLMIISIIISIKGYENWSE